MLILQYRLLRDQKMLLDEKTFQRTYAGKKLKSQGAFSWTASCKKLSNGQTVVVGSCFPVSAFAKRGIRISIFTGWKDIELLPEEDMDYADKT
jgi:hypothetical protein